MMFISKSNISVSQQMSNMKDFVLKKFVEWKEDILHLIFPSLCVICENELSKYEKNICHLCYEELRFTHFENYFEETTLDKLFWGRVVLQSTYSMLYFEKESSTQKILHQIKYKNNQMLAVEMGNLLGEKIKNQTKFENLEALVPVPLHPKKQYLRGYNQSELIAKGMSETSSLPVNLDLVSRIQHAESQTKKSKFLRWDNIEEAFFVNKNEINKMKHIAIIDDVITTGSTLESLIIKIKEVNKDIKISIISLALTK